MEQGRSLELFFVDGNPEGMLTAEVFNWTGHILKFPRTQVRDGLARAEARHTGVYLLLGEQDGQPLAYIGEGEAVASRIRDHDAQREWWTQAVIVTTTSDALHKAHVKYLESRLVETALAARVCRLENGNAPPRSSLSEASRANMEEFLATLFMVLPALGITLFQSGRRDVSAPGAVAKDETEAFWLRTPRNGVDAQAVLRGSEFIVLKGSTVRPAWMGKGEHDFGYRLLHEKLVMAGIISIVDGAGVFTQDYAFNSPSAAAAVANGRPANGRLEWKCADGMTYGNWEAEQLTQVTP